MGGTFMNLLMQSKKDKIQQINQCANDLMTHQKQHLVQKESIEKMDVHAIGKMVSKAKLILKYKKEGKEIKKRLEELKNLNNSELLFLIATHPVAIPLYDDTSDFPCYAQGHSLTTCYYYAFDLDQIAPQNIRVILNDRFGLKNEIDVQKYIKISTNLNGKISRKDEMKVHELIDSYVESKMQKENPQQWKDLRNSIQKDLAENKNIFKPTEKDKSMEQ